MIHTEKHLFFILKTDKHTIDKIIKNIDSYYLSWNKKKTHKETGEVIMDSNGNPKTRQLNTTLPPLKAIQKQIYNFLLNNTAIPSYCYGGVPGRDNVRNARYHQGNKYIFTTDIKSFFPSISHKQIFELYRKFQFSPTVSRILTQLTTYKGKLPQGVPTSTLLANLVFSEVGDQIDKIALEHNAKFTIFVDDVTISSKQDFKSLIPDIIEIINKSGFKISHKKTLYKTKNPIVTGVKCQNNKLKLQQSYYKRLSRLKIDNLSLQYRGLAQYKKRVAKI